MAREITWNDFSGGLWVMPPTDKAPRTALPRAKGIHAISTPSARSRRGTELAFAGTAHSLYRFNDKRYSGESTTLNSEGAALTLPTGVVLDGTRLTFARMPPTFGKADSLFVSGGGKQLKIDADDGVTLHGIEAPADGFTVTKNAQVDKSIEEFEDHTDFTASDVTKSDEATKLQEASASLKLIVAESTTGKVWRALGSTADLTDFSGTTSPDEDFITLWVMVESPENLDYIQIVFDVSTGGFDGDGDTTDAYTFTSGPISENGLFDLISGIASTAEDLTVRASQEAQNSSTPGLDDEDTGTPNPAISSVKRRWRRQLEELATDEFADVSGTWIKLRIPKALFVRSGSGSKTWTEVEGVKFAIKTNSGGSATAYLDDLRLQGSVGMQGRYKLLITYKNFTTGHRSNPNPTPVIVADVDRQSLAVAALPSSSDDAQVDTVQIWRTLGDGSLYFLDTEVTMPTTTATINKADFFGLDSNASDALLDGEQLTFNHHVPFDTFNYVAGPHQGRLWWLDSENSDRVYYSRAGKPEAVEGSVKLGGRDDPTQALAIFAGFIFCLTQGQWWKITGTTTPFIAFPMDGIPGTTAPHTVSKSPGGIVWEADDGVRGFNGATSELISPAAVVGVFQGDAHQDLPAFSGVVATLWRGRYYISDGASTTLCVDSQGRWRDLGIGVIALYREPDTRRLIASTGGDVVVLEQESTDDDAGTAISFEIETSPFKADVYQASVVRNVYVEADTAGQVLTATLIHDGATTALGSVQTTGRKVVKLGTNTPARIISVRLAGSLTDAVEVFEIAADVPPVSAQ